MSENILSFTDYKEKLRPEPDFRIPEDWEPVTFDPFSDAMDLKQSFFHAYKKECFNDPDTMQVFWAPRIQEFIILITAPDTQSTSAFVRNEMNGSLKAL